MDPNKNNNNNRNPKRALAKNNPITFEFPITHPKEDALMKNIPHNALPVFCGLSI
jgi:hypothetical protein